MLAVNHQMSYKNGIKGVEAPSIPNQNEGLVRMASYKIKQLPDNIKIPKGARAIPLSQGYYTLVDEEDYKKASQHNWHIHINGKHRYAITNVRLGVNKRITVKLHRLILDFPSKPIDHINHNGLDNRKSNLRTCTSSQNCMNRQPRGSLTTKGLKQTISGKWSARIQVNGKRRWLGAYNTKEEAQAVYNAAAKELFRDFASGVPVDKQSVLLRKATKYREQIHAVAKCPTCNTSFCKTTYHHKYCCVQCKERARPKRLYKPRKKF